MLGSLGGDAYATGVVRALFPFKDAGNLTELATDLYDHFLRGAANGVHGEATEQEGHHGTDENTHKNHRVHERNIVVLNYIRNATVGKAGEFGRHFSALSCKVAEADLDFLYVGSQQRKGRKGCRTYCKAFSGCGGGVAKGVKDVCLFTHGRVKLAHLGVAAGIVGDGAVSVCGKGDSKGGEHTYCRN